MLFTAHQIEFVTRYNFRNPDPDLTRMFGQHDYRVPPSITALYFTSADKVAIFKNSLGQYIGYQLQWHFSDCNGDLNLHESVICGRYIEAPEIFLKSYRTKVCATCKLKKSSDQFYWKQKSAEGPFRQLWIGGKRQSSCIECEAGIKAKAYVQRIRRQRELTRKKIIKVREVRTLDPDKFKINEQTLDSNKTPLVSLRELLIDFASEVITDV